MSLKLWFLSIIISIVAPFVLDKPLCKQKEKPKQKTEPFNPHSYFQNRLISDDDKSHKSDETPSYKS